MLISADEREAGVTLCRSVVEVAIPGFRFSDEQW